MIDYIIWSFLGISALITWLGLGTENRHVSIILFIEFLVMMAYQGLTPADYGNMDELATFYLGKAGIQTLFFIGYVLFFNNTIGYALAFMSYIISWYLMYTWGMALFGVYNANYEIHMVILSSIQLIIGSIGVRNGAISAYTWFSNRFVFGSHKRA